MAETARTVRVDDELWNAAREVAREKDTTMSQVIRQALRKFVATGTVLVAAMLAFGAGASDAEATTYPDARAMRVMFDAIGPWIEAYDDTREVVDEFFLRIALIAHNDDHEKR